ncbi:MAG: serine acetyltransferase [Oscillospiraceae bacterium]
MITRILMKLLGGIWAVKNKCAKSKNRLLIRLYFYYLGLHQSYIGYNADLEEPPTFPHGLSGIFISEGAYIGKNCVIFQQVTIGSNTLQDSKLKGSPHIGDNCYIGAGAKIIGKVTIGNNVRIGANCVVTIDIPDNHIVVMEKPRLIYKENMDNTFYNIDRISNS